MLVGYVQKVGGENPGWTVSLLKKSVEAFKPWVVPVFRRWIGRFGDGDCDGRRQHARKNQTAGKNLSHKQYVASVTNKSPYFRKRIPKGPSRERDRMILRV